TETQPTWTGSPRALEGSGLRALLRSAGVVEQARRRERLETRPVAGVLLALLGLQDRVDRALARSVVLLEAAEGLVKADELSVRDRVETLAALVGVGIQTADPHLFRRERANGGDEARLVLELVFDLGERRALHGTTSSRRAELVAVALPARNRLTAVARS